MVIQRTVNTTRSQTLKVKTSDGSVELLLGGEIRLRVNDHYEVVEVTLKREDLRALEHLFQLALVDTLSPNLLGTTSDTIPLPPLHTVGGS